MDYKQGVLANPRKANRGTLMVRPVLLHKDTFFFGPVADLSSLLQYKHLNPASTVRRQLHGGDSETAVVVKSTVRGVSPDRFYFILLLK